MDDKEILVGLVKDCTKAISDNTNKLDQIHKDFEKVLTKYDSFGQSINEFGKTLIWLKALMTIAVGLLGTIFITFIAYILSG
jgi:hypothetical protein